MLTVVGIWMHDEPLGLAAFDGDLEPVDAKDYEFADVQTWVTYADSIADAENVMRESITGED